ncbi:zinc finger MYM-type protein 1-like protein [Tanacetum coccineum]
MPGDTRWSSHFRSICSLKSLCGQRLAVTRSTTSQKGDVACCLEQLRSFDFVIGMHIMNEIMEITDKICQALQHKSHDIINALALVSTTKTLLQRLRDEDWQSLMGKVTLACEDKNFLILDMNATYRNLIQSHKKKKVTINESVTELLRLSVALDQRKSFNIDDICKLVMKYYPLDFTD